MGCLRKPRAHTWHISFSTLALLDVATNALVMASDGNSKTLRDWAEARKQLNMVELETGKRFREDSLLLIRGLDSAADSFSQRLKMGEDFVIFWVCLTLNMKYETLAEVAEPGLNLHVGTVILPLLVAMGDDDDDVQKSAKKAAETVVLVIDEEGIDSLISELLRGVSDGP